MDFGIVIEQPVEELAIGFRDTGFFPAKFASRREALPFSTDCYPDPTCLRRHRETRFQAA